MTGTVRAVDENPWTKALALLGLAAAVVGVIMLLIPSDPIDLSRLLLGLAVLTLGCTAAVCWLLLAGLGWYLRRAPAR